MKRIFLLVISMTILLSLFACGETTTQNNPTDAINDSELQESENNWELRYYVDEFNRPTSEGYVTNKDLFEGTFSNTATTDSKLNARIIADECNIAIKLWEYGRSEVKTSSYEKYDITILKQDGTKQNVTGTMYDNRIYIGGHSYFSLIDPSNDSYHQSTADVLKILREGGEVSFFIVESDRPSTKYLFTADTTGFLLAFREFHKSLM